MKNVIAEKRLTINGFDNIALTLGR